LKLQPTINQYKDPFLFISLFLSCLMFRLL
jgi:hypothetical protein